MKIEEILKIFDALELEIIKLQKENLSKFTVDSKIWEQMQLNNLERYKRKLAVIVSAYQRRINDKAAATVLDTYAKQASKEAERLIGKYNLNTDGLNSIQSFQDGVKQGIAETNPETLAAVVSGIQNDMTKATYNLYRQASDVYRQTIQESAILAATGNKTMTECIDIAQRDFLEKGIGHITYANGARVNIRSYAEMALRTNNQRAVIQGQALARKRLNLPYVKVSSHGGTCEHCAPYQGMVLIDDVYADGQPDGKHILLSEAMANNFMHPNCRHSLITCDPDVDDDVTTEYEYTAEDAQRYKDEQHQRYLEREVRMWKRKEAGYVNQADIKKAKQNLSMAQAELRDFVESREYLARDYTREKI